MPNIEIRHITFLALMCSDLDDEGEFWKEDTHKSFLSLRSAQSYEEEPPSTLCPDASARIALKHLLRATDDLFNVQGSLVL